jgi:hypothetical protein
LLLFIHHSTIKSIEVEHLAHIGANTITLITSQVRLEKISGGMIKLENIGVDNGPESIADVFKSVSRVKY